MNVSKLFAKWEEDYKFIKQNAKGIYLNPFISDLMHVLVTHQCEMPETNIFH